MGLLWPAYLLLLTAIPLVVGAYVLVLRRRRRFAVQYSSLSLIRQAMPGGFRWRRHLPFALTVLAITLLILALARPFANVTVAASRTTVMLALDVSLSMCADDVSPNRLTVAQEATEKFIDSQETGTRVGIVAFAGIAQLIAPPTTDKEVLLEAVANLTTARATAVGSAIARSLDALAEVNPDIPPVSVFVSPREAAVEPGVEDGIQPDVIVLLTDGASNRGVLPLRAARAARDRGVRVYTIGFGTASPAVLRCTPEQLGGDELANRIGRGGFGSFGRGFGRGNFLRLDEQTLTNVAEITDAEYYLAESADELLEVFSTIPLQIEKKKVRMEVSAVLTAISALLALSAVALSPAREGITRCWPLPPAPASPLEPAALISQASTCLDVRFSITVRQHAIAPGPPVRIRQPLTTWPI